MPESRKTTGTGSIRKLMTREPNSTLAVKSQGRPANTLLLRNHFASTALSPLSLQYAVNTRTKMVNSTAALLNASAMTAVGVAYPVKPSATRQIMLGQEKLMNVQP